MNNIENLVIKLPEVYQKIYKHPEYDSSSSRGCDDRADAIIPIIKEYQKKTEKKKIKILDIGCAQGYYGFKLAELGCEVKGIDFCPENIDLCKAIADENKIKISFEKNIFNKEFIDNIKNTDFDIVLVLSVFHHIAHEKGFDYAKDLMDSLSKKAKILITELALKEEPLYWNDNLPQDYYDWVKDFAFYKGIKFFPTHLSGINRPLLFCSNSYVLCNDRLFFFNKVSDKSFEKGVKACYKKYYLDEKIFIKKVLKKPGNSDSNNLFNEVLNEIAILKEYSKKISFFPRLIDVEKSEEKILVVYQVRKGILLYDLINEKLDKERIISDVLNQLIELEKNNLYHSDIRLWNVVCLPDGSSQLIDIGAIHKKNKRDCLQETFGRVNISVYESFLIFIADLLLDNTFTSIYSGFYTLDRRYFDKKIPLRYKYFFIECLLEQKGLNYRKIKNIFQHRVIDKKPMQGLTPLDKLLLQELMNNQKRYSILVMDHFKAITETKQISEEQGKNLGEQKQELSDHSRAIGWHWKLLEEQERLLEEQGQEIADQSGQIKEQTGLLGKHESAIGDQGRRLSGHDEAIERLRKSMSDHDKAISGLGGSLSEQASQLGEHEKAIGSLDSAVKLQGKNLGEQKQELSDHSRAIENFRKKFEAQEKLLNIYDEELQNLRRQLNRMYDYSLIHIFDKIKKK
ncbi:MAG: methyltransferase domain-containing protein [Spirochaetia bacterium]|nr:methyltransferase domain-containing protein [Spirochaetia bacterium]